MIKAIETDWHGFRFRSRLEARWAVFFDALDLEYIYVPEPDCEAKIRKLAQESKMSAGIVFGDPMRVIDSPSLGILFDKDGDPYSLLRKFGMPDEIHRAALKARSARFEHGETP
jgi:hypothetical protein